MRMKGYPRWFYSGLLLVMAVLFASGCLLIPTVFELKLEWEMPWRLPAGQHVAVAAIHATVSFVVLGMIGALWSVHMRSGWRRKRNLHTGLVLLGTMLLLALSAVGIYYLGDGDASMAASVLHLAVGIMAALLIVAHDLIGRRYHAHH
jgi:hypothetical protein